MTFHFEPHLNVTERQERMLDELGVHKNHPAVLAILDMVAGLKFNYSRTAMDLILTDTVGAQQNLHIAAAFDVVHKTLRQATDARSKAAWAEFDEERAAAEELIVDGLLGAGHQIG